jgi:hypothetical protein
MFKKNVWIVGLFAALAIMFVGCLEPEADTSGGLQETVVFDLETDEGIQALKVGRLTFTNADDGNPIAPLVKAGDIPGHISRFEAVAGPNGISLKYISVASWGPGFDLNNSVFNFREGDVIKVAGKILSGSGKVQLNSKVGAENAIASFDGTGAFSLEATLTAANVGEIKGGNPAAIRFEARTGGLEIQIDTINIKGMRSASETPDPEPEYGITGAGKYVPPASKGNDIYIDLNETLIGQLTPAAHLPYAFITGTTEEGKPGGNLIVNFDTDRQAIFIPFTDEVKGQISDAAKNGFTFDVTVNGTQGATTGVLRWCFGADRTGSWNQTDMVGVARTTTAVDTFNKVNNIKPTGSDLYGIVMQTLPTDNGAELANKFTMIIGSIKVTLKAPTNAITKARINLAAPIAGLSAVTSVSLVIVTPGQTDQNNLTTVGTGTITWTPPPVSGKYTTSTVYQAAIVVSPAPNYYFVGDFAPAINSFTDYADVYNYDPGTKTVYTKPFPATAATPPPVAAYRLSMDAKFQALEAQANIGDNTPMNAILNDATKTDFPSLFSANSNGTWSIVKVDGKNCLQLVSGSWNDGLGILDDAFHFSEGDRVLVNVNITAYTLASGQSNSGIVGKAIGGWNPIAFQKIVDSPATLAAGDHKVKCTVTAPQAVAWAGKGINVGLNNGASDPGFTLIFKEIIIYGPDKPAPTAWNWTDQMYNEW